MNSWKGNGLVEDRIKTGSTSEVMRMKNKNNKKESVWMNPIHKTNEWFIENGYTDPMEMIDHSGNLELADAFLNIFVAYNQHNIAEGKVWDTWPEWELCLTSMNDDLHFVNKENDSPELLAEREHWLAVMQFMHDSDTISIEQYTITIKGNFGNTFSFDFALAHQGWGAPGTFAEHKKILDADGLKPKAWMWAPRQYESKSQIGHSLGPFWVCPEHVPKHGGESTIHTSDVTFCIDGMNENYPSNLLSLIQLCIDDRHIWSMQFGSDVYEQVRIEWWEEHWPFGRPEDFNCQYSKEEFSSIKDGWKREANNRIEQGGNQNEEE
jgi:hypothetical protein